MAGGNELAEREEADSVRPDGVEALVVRGRALVGAEQLGLRRTIYVGVDQADFLAGLRDGDGEVGREGRLADSALAARDRDKLPAWLARGKPDADFANARNESRGRLQICLQRLAFSGSEAARVGDDRRDTAGYLARPDPARFGKSIESGKNGFGVCHRWCEIGTRAAVATVFRQRPFL